MQSAVASIHQLQAISCCKQESRPAVDTTDGSPGVAEPAGVRKTNYLEKMDSAVEDFSSRDVIQAY
ncbi:hypothetical protein F511_30013 [Dorcoceras hygrometricum]|uniref:Uncharacterized protein n=1 Tax=Dorcoceras hygrometricum TaxID=472368 RepID=A0A2Z7BK71_9LAMI|nr:hypothetical protein F511_30013 [Dorcoceras hygrometricum]